MFRKRPPRGCKRTDRYSTVPTYRGTFDRRNNTWVHGHGRPEGPGYLRVDERTGSVEIGWAQAASRGGGLALLVAVVAFALTLLFSRGDVVIAFAVAGLALVAVGVRLRRRAATRSVDLSRALATTHYAVGSVAWVTWDDGLDRRYVGLTLAPATLRRYLGDHGAQWTPPRDGRVLRSGAAARALAANDIEIEVDGWSDAPTHVRPIHPRTHRAGAAGEAVSVGVANVEFDDAFDDIGADADEAPGADAEAAAESAGRVDTAENVDLVAAWGAVGDAAHDLPIDVWPEEPWVDRFANARQLDAAMSSDGAAPSATPRGRATAIRGRRGRRAAREAEQAAGAADADAADVSSRDAADASGPAAGRRGVAGGDAVDTPSADDEWAPSAPAGWWSLSS